MIKCDICKEKYRNNEVTALKDVMICDSCWEKAMGPASYLPKGGMSEKDIIALLKLRPEERANIQNQYIERDKQKEATRRKEYEATLGPEDLPLGNEQRLSVLERVASIGEETYEYMVISVVDRITGACDVDALQRKLNNLAMRGWRVKAVVSNELGKNALMLLGIGINGTIDQQIIILERNIKLSDIR